MHPGGSVRAPRRAREPLCICLAGRTPAVFSEKDGTEARSARGCVGTICACCFSNRLTAGGALAGTSPGPEGGRKHVVSMSSDDWESEDDEQLSQSLSQSLSQEPAGLVVPKQESDDSWASEDDEQLSQELLSQQSSEPPGSQLASWVSPRQSGEPPGSRLASWVSPRIKLEEAMDAARLSLASMPSPTLDSIGTTLDADDDGNGSSTGSSSSDSGSSDSDGDTDDHPFLRRCARNELDMRLGVPAWRQVEADAPEPIENAQASARVSTDIGGADGKPCAVIGQTWTERERHLFFRALRRCGKHPHNISKRVGTKSPIEVAVYLRQLHAASAACGAVGEGDSDGEDLTGSSTEDEAEAEDAGDCRWTPSGFQPKRPAGGFSGRRCLHWPACEGDESLPSRTIWEQRGWSGLALHEQEALKLLGLNNLARYLAQKTGYHSFASYDSGAVLELHAQLVTLLASVVSAASIQAVQRARTRDNRGKPDTKATAVVTLSDVAMAASGVAPYYYSERLLHSWASQPLPVNPFGNRTYRPVTERSAVWTQARPVSVSIGNQQIIGPICSLPSVPPSTATMIEVETQMREGTLRQHAFTEQDIQRAVEHGPVGGGVVVGMKSNEKLDLTSPELLFLHHSVLKKLQARTLYHRKAKGNASFRMAGRVGEADKADATASTLDTLCQNRRASVAGPPSSGSETAIEIDLESEPESEQSNNETTKGTKSRVQAEGEETREEDEEGEEDDDDEAAALAQEEAERELARAARAARLAAQRADPAARRAGFSPIAPVAPGQHSSTPQSATGQDHQDTGARAKRGNSGMHDAGTKRRKRVSETPGDTAAADACGPRADDPLQQVPPVEPNGPPGNADGAAAGSRDFDQVESVPCQQLHSRDRHRHPSTASAPVCFKFQWDKPQLAAVDSGFQAAPREFLAEWPLLYQENTLKTKSQLQRKQKRRRKSVPSENAKDRSSEHIASGEQVAAGTSDAVDSNSGGDGGNGGGTAAPNASAAPDADASDGVDRASGGSTDDSDLDDDLTTGIDLLTALAAGKQRAHSDSSSNNNSENAGVNDGDNNAYRHDSASGVAMAAPPPASRTRLDGTTTTSLQTSVPPGRRDQQAAREPTPTTEPPAGSSGKARERQHTAANKRTRSPWGDLLHNLLQHAHHNHDLDLSASSPSEPAVRMSLTFDGSAAHVLRILAESFLRRRWEQAIAAATHVRVAPYQARRVVVLRADVALWATDEVSKRGAALQISIARRAVADSQKLKPGDLVRIPHGKRAFAKCATARQQARAAVPKNSSGRVVSCANGYYTVSLEGESTFKFRRSELQLVVEPCDSGPRDT